MDLAYSQRVKSLASIKFFPVMGTPSKEGNKEDLATVQTRHSSLSIVWTFKAALTVKFGYWI